MKNVARPPFASSASKIRDVAPDGPSSKVNAIIGLDGSTADTGIAGSSGSPAPFFRTARRIPSTRRPWASTPAVSPFVTRDVQAPF